MHAQLAPVRKGISARRVRQLHLTAAVRIGRSADAAERIAGRVRVNNPELERKRVSVQYDLRAIGRPRGCRVQHTIEGQPPRGNRAVCIAASIHDADLEGYYARSIPRPYS